MSIAIELGQRIAAVKYEDLPQDAVHWAKVGVLDTVGVTLAGCNEHTAQLAARALGAGAGPSHVLGTDRRVSALDAAVINGAASHALDFDDCNNTFGGHPSAPVLSALFALADEVGASGREFIAAYVAGFEAETKIALGVNFHHYMKGWHPTATLGVFGSAAACSKLLKLDAAKTAVALAAAASFASGIKANFGTMMKPLHVGHCARNGLYAALLAREGYTANAQSVFEHKQGFLDVFNGPDTYDAAKIVAAWAKPWDIIEPGIAIKQYPCCGSTHPAIDAMLNLVREHDVKATDVERIESWTHTRRLEHTNRPNPQSALDAKFSVQYCLARAVIDRKVAIDQFEGDAYKDAKTRELTSRVKAAAYTTAQFPADNHFGAEVKVTLKNGRVLSHKVNQPYGRTSKNPLTREQLKDKFVNCALRALPADRVEQLYNAIDGLDQANDARTIAALASLHHKSAARTALAANA
ncbi:MAG: MmgE/PrpD family protein [Burkholderiales bacterium]